VVTSNFIIIIILEIVIVIVIIIIIIIIINVIYMAQIRIHAANAPCQLLQAL